VRPYPGYTIGIMVVLGLMLALQITLLVQRFFEKEIHAIIFSFLAISGHLVLFIMLFLSIDPLSFVFVFSLLWIMGEYVKIMFLFVVDQFEVLWLKRPILYILSLLQIVAHVVLVILVVLDLTIEYHGN